MTTSDYYFGVAPDIDHVATAHMRGNPEPVATGGPFESPKTAREWAASQGAEAVEIISNDRDTGKVRSTYFTRRQFPYEPVRWDKVSASAFRSAIRGQRG